MQHTLPKPVPYSIAAGLARSEAQIAAGQNVPLGPVLDRLRASIAHMQADETLKATTTLKLSFHLGHFQLDWDRRAISII